MRRFYDFCRYTDDLVDEGSSDLAVRRERLDAWREELEHCFSGRATHPILKGLLAVLRDFEIPKHYFFGLIDGVQMDLEQARYATFAELRKYCYGVASTVGLISIHIFGAKHAESREYAENLGYALQLTNILRDVKHDASNGRIYLPLEDLHQFGYEEQSLLNSHYNDRFRALMAFEARRAREYYTLARSFLRKDERRVMFAAQAMDAIYFRLLEQIERADYDVFSKHLSVSTPHKLLIAANYWAQSRIRRSGQ